MKVKKSNGPGGVLLYLLAALSWSVITTPGASRTMSDYALLVNVELTASPPKIRLAWPPASDATGFVVSRRVFRENNWTKLATLDASAQEYVDTAISPGVPYEYQVVKSTSADYSGYGYVLSGIELPLVENRGRVILLVENTVAAALVQELLRMEQDLIGDGWTVARANVSASASPPEIKKMIKDLYAQDPQNTRALYLFGNVPVPYSGNITPDEHDNHRGAWPADAYYGDLDGEWTDTQVNTTSPERQWNWNVPGDGKFDQSVIPSNLELMVGRVDLSRMTCFSNKTPSRSELDLLQQYLEKDHRFRHRTFDVPHRALYFDVIWLSQPEPLAAGSWRNLYPMFGNEIDHCPSWQYFSKTKTNSYLFSMVTAGGGWYHADGVGTSDSFAIEEVNAVFTTFCGSYYGDWDNESSFLRAPLGASGRVLTTCYAGKPQWFFFPMAGGFPVGEGAKLTQENRRGGLYPPFNPGTGEVHITLHGDPTLRMQPIAPPSSLTGTVDGSRMRLSWGASRDANLKGYLVYKAASPIGPFTRVTPSLLTGTSFEDANYKSGETYMVKAVALSSSGTATYWNASQGLFFPDSLRQQTAETLPGAPKFLEIDELRADYIRLDWVAGSANHEGFKVERKAPGTTEYKVVANVGPDARSYTDSALPARGTYYYRVRAFNSKGLSPYSNEVSGSTLLSTVEFVSVDKSTSGNWIGSYGAVGAEVIGKYTNMPPYSSVTVSNLFLSNYGTGSDPRGLVIPGTEQRSLSLLGAGGPFAIDVTFSDGKPHLFSVYLVDWSRLNRAFRIEAWDPVRRVILDSREINSFEDGVYLSYVVMNRALFAITPTSEERTFSVYGFFVDEPRVGTPVISPASGPFAGKTTVSISTPTGGADIHYTLDGSTPTTGSLKYTQPFVLGASATVKARAFKSGYIESRIVSADYVNTLVTRAGFLAADTSTKGNWRNVYGKEGYNVRLGSVSMPRYGSIAFSNAQEWYWSDNTPEERAPYKSPHVDTRVAAVWYSADELSIDVNIIDVKSHAVAFYFLDWDRNGREQLVQVVDPAGNVLQQETLSHFEEGKYLVFNLQGTVTIKMKRIKGNNAILNAIFFDPAPVETYQPGPVKFESVTVATGLGFRITGDAGTKICIDHTDDLLEWTCTGEQMIPTGGLVYEADMIESDGRFFRCHIIPPQ